jgi:hypothetical protein
LSGLKKSRNHRIGSHKSGVILAWSIRLVTRRSLAALKQMRRRDPVSRWFCEIRSLGEHGSKVFSQIGTVHFVGSYFDNGVRNSGSGPDFI